MSAAAAGAQRRTIARHLIERSGLTRATGATGAVTVVQRFGSGLNLNVHFHVLFLDGAYRAADGEPPVFRPAPAPGAEDLQRLVERIAAQVGEVLERRGLIERDLEHAWLTLDGEAGPLDDVLGHSITYRIAVGPRAGQKLFTLQTLPPRLDGLDRDGTGAARGRVLAARGRGRGAARACDARAAVPVHQSSAGGDGALGADAVGAGALCAQDAVPGRHHAPGAGAPGPDGAAGGAGRQSRGCT